ncbi:hypothetical protein FIBSPDRAFT_230209 [Athelia psychrophila]|uniref:Uncharacterized protein n=1 Tax=Athelia psychrophila TaxID=1759441 RepID=A0A165YPW5_9AGAM|nr:hypothetical protein FIBSPDRAFT_230209 [Fibularhizoctonia sp. CBS 109695]
MGRLHMLRATRLTPAHLIIRSMALARHYAVLGSPYDVNASMSLDVRARPMHVFAPSMSPNASAAVACNTNPYIVSGPDAQRIDGACGLDEWGMPFGGGLREVDKDLLAGSGAGVGASSSPSSG